jgi:hypothetical protein
MKKDFFTLKNHLYQRAQMVPLQTNLCYFRWYIPFVKFVVKYKILAYITLLRASDLPEMRKKTIFS